ncbi:reverse transcriptase [Cucumis melo var. makuwa]|uniref:Reverse transcriptase n=1 Tax=Cucumis melo var. makuwa TaxID=1194695 RepID=A0A5D3CX61_CUCMM|nr:reverse transcriptase [Cucumis melo var. makuwa]TYK16055.1 reverse transcriptase [Cucumis melo var. makuwa]
MEAWVKWQLQEPFFEEVSGLRINSRKCSVMGMDCGEEKLKRWLELVGCEVGRLPSSYLGFPLESHPRVAALPLFGFNGV